MRPRFVDQCIFAITHPGWRPKSPGQTAPCIVVIAYLDSDGQPWLYTDEAGLQPISVPDESHAPR